MVRETLAAHSGCIVSTLSLVLNYPRLMSHDFELKHITVSGTSNLNPSRGEASHVTTTPPDIGAAKVAGAEAGFSDGSGALYSIYLDGAKVEDQKMTESWKGDADGILFFVCNSSFFLRFSNLHP
jgi:hypothetical protein